ncbi:MAG: hypothetical protein RJA70_817 [Pseudomonadota bacterium]|jgi:hypothetical protein
MATKQSVGANAVKTTTKQARELGLTRQVSLSERGLVWGLLGLILSAAFALGLVLIAQGRFSSVHPDLWGTVIRGYTGYGELMGVMAVLFALLTFAFSLRKRALQERLKFLRGTMMAWLWVHVVAGVLTLVAATLHAGVGLMDYQVTTGKLLYWLLLWISVSGVVWRLVYKWIPRQAAPQVGNFSPAISSERAAKSELELEKIAAGRSEVLRQWKDWLLERPRTEAELQGAKAQFLASPEAPVFARLCELAASRDRSLARAKKQQAFISRLQGWRILHVPLSFLFMGLIVLHVLEAYDFGPKYLPRSIRSNTALPAAITGHHDPKDCGTCHQAIYDQWKHSMHAHALTSPLMIAQSNQVTRQELAGAKSPDPKRICVNCHAPITTELAQQELLPFPGGPRMNEGITCTVCHQFTGQSRIGGGAFTEVIIDHLDRGRVMYGRFSGAVGNTSHQSRVSPVLDKDPSVICQNCHDVNYDRSGDGQVQVGTDLVLQTTYQEYVEYRASGGQGTCTECHMPIVAGAARVAERSGLAQDSKAPPRVLRDHSFVGVDHPLDIPGAADPHRPMRQALLQRAATFVLDNIQFDKSRRRLSAQVEITNSGAGHTLPSGFAFARQMWIEFTVEDAATGAQVFSSGVLQKNTDDLCDAGTFDDLQSPIRTQMQGCTASDPQLVNFQKKLVDKAEVERDAQGFPLRNPRGELIPKAAKDATEQSIQRVAGNPITRRRPSDGQLLGSIPPDEGRRFSYNVTIPERSAKLRLKARLLFRNLPPYFVRDIAKNQPATEVPQLMPMLKNLDIVEMAVANGALELPVTDSDFREEAAPAP